MGGVLARRRRHGWVKDLAAQARKKKKGEWGKVASCSLYVKQRLGGRELFMLTSLMDAVTLPL